MWSQLSPASAALIASILGLTYYIFSRILKPYRQYRLYRQIVTTNYKAMVYPFALTLIDYIKREHQDTQKHGDSQYTAKYVYREYQVIMNMFNGEVYIDLIDPQLIRQFYEKTAEWCYAKAEKGYFVVPARLLLGPGLLLTEGLEWKSKRKIMSHVFNYDFIKSKINTISKIAKEILDKYDQIGAVQGGKQIKYNLNYALQQIFANVVIKCFFGDITLRDIREGESIFHFLDRMLILSVQRSTTVLSLLFGPRFITYNLRPIDRRASKMIEQFNQYAENIINQQIKSVTEGSKTDSKSKNQINGVIQLLIKSNKLKQEQRQLTDEQKKTKDYYTTKDLIYEFKTFFSAGTDTTANNTTVLFYLLAKHKDVSDRLRKEIDQVIGDDLENITYEKLKQMKYMEKVQKEALRMASPTTGIFKREAVKDHYIGNIPIKKGMIVTVSMNPNHFKEQFYTTPQIFNPDRWDTIDSTKAEHYSFFPFSSGQRNCIGQHLAMIEGKIALIHFLRRYKEIKPEKTEFRLYFRTTYGAESMITTFVK